MDDRRLVGIDLGITSAHTVRVLAGDGGLVCRRKAIPTVDSRGEVERAALAETPAGTLLEVVVEPTGPAWLPIAVFFCARGHTVYRVSSAKAHDLRRVLSRHAKSNGIDADTLARLPLVDPAGLHPLQLPEAAGAALDRRVRACDRLTRQAATHKRRIKDLVHQLLPASPLTGELGQADLAVLERWADPHALVAVGRVRLQRVLAKASAGQQGAARAEQWLAAARAALKLYGDHPAIAWQELAAEVHTEVRLLRATQAELDLHAGQREACYQRVDPAALARSLPGLATIGGPALVATMGLYGYTDLRGRWLDPAQPRPSSYMEALWGFLLKELPDGRTRLVISGYQTFRPRWVERIASWLLILLSWPMQARMMAVLKRNIERAARTGATTVPDRAAP